MAARPPNRAAAAQAPSQQAAPTPSGIRTWVGAGLLLVALGASLVLALDHLGAIDAPGCGARSPCATLAEGRWGRIPGLEWPVSFLGTAWFAALLAGWMSSRGRPNAALTRLTRIGGIGSIVYTSVMVVERVLCPYCLAAHLANFAFWAVCARSARPQAAGEAGKAGPPGKAGAVGKAVPAGRTVGPGRRPRWPVAAAVLVFAAGSAALGVAESVLGSRARADAERRLAEAQAAIRGADPDAARGFSGRYRLGPESARVRIVVFTDYQCPDCAMVEEQVEAAVRAGGDLAVSAKHFPMCTDCNPHAANLHANACWAARAAEAGGVLRGVEGFWKVHRWLFARGGSFTNEELAAGLRELGFPHEAFLDVMQGPETLARVKADIAEGMSLGLFQTPMIFINGVELKGWNAPGAVARAIAAALESSPAPAEAPADRPPSAVEKVLDDWFNQPPAAIPVDNAPRLRGIPGAPVQVVMWGDYQEANTAEADRTIRELMSTLDISYDFRPFPFNQDCNPAVPRTAHPLACLAAQAAEAAAVLGGEEGFIAMHEWLMDHREDLDEESLMVVAPALGLDREALWEAMQTPELMGAILEDAAAGHEVGVTTIPTIFINGRLVPRWKVGEENLLPFLIDAAVGVP